jgi:hypothetical protein
MEFTHTKSKSYRFIRGSLAVAVTVLWLSTAGCGKGQNSVPGLEKFQAGVLQSRLYVSFVSTTLNWDQGITFPIPGLTDATVSVAPDLTTSGTVFQFSIGLAALLDHAQALPKSGLPDGRALPDIEGGQLPRWDAQVKNLKLSLYLSDDAFGLFVPLSFISKGVTLPVMISVQLKDERGNILGKVYAIPSDETQSSSQSGLFVLLPYLGAGPNPGGKP